MPLSKGQKEKLANWLYSKNTNPDCPSCGRNEWSFGEIVGAPLYPEGIAHGGESVLMVQLICQNCSFVRAHAAVPIGLLEDKPEETKETY